METINTYLLREKIIITDEIADDNLIEEKEAIVIRSNRIAFTIGNYPSTEKIVVRTQNMHSAMRLAANILYSYYKGGLLMKRSKPVDFLEEWNGALSKYDKKYNDEIWGAIYINGKHVLKTLDSPFTDIIEQCALLTKDNYEAIVNITEKTLKQLGKEKKVDHLSNIAATVKDNGDSVDCGIIQRIEGHDSIFKFNVAKGGDKEFRLVQSLNVIAAFLEIFNLHFFVKDLQEKIKLGVINKISPEALHLRAAISRKANINKGIAKFESKYDVSYKLGKPDLYFR